MKEPRVLVTMKDIQRYKVIKDVLDKKLKAVSAAQLKKKIEKKIGALYFFIFLFLFYP